MRNPVQIIVYVLLAAVRLAAGQQVLAAEVKLLNVASDVKRGFYQDYKAANVAFWKVKTGQTVTISHFNGDSRRQSRSVIGQTIHQRRQPTDIDVLNESRQFLEANWVARLPNQSVPFTSMIVFPLGGSVRQSATHERATNASSMTQNGILSSVKWLLTQSAFPARLLKLINQYPKSMRRIHVIDAAIGNWMTPWEMDPGQFYALISTVEKLKLWPDVVIVILR